jgi:hypothetical protein
VAVGITLGYRYRQRGMVVAGILDMLTRQLGMSDVAFRHLCCTLEHEGVCDALHSVEHNVKTKNSIKLCVCMHVCVGAD